MKRRHSLLAPLMLLSLPGCLYSQLWSGILDPSRAIDWSAVGIPGGIPPRTTICTTLTSSATTAQINSALASCPSGQTVFLSAGTYSITGNIVVPSNVTLRGAGADQTILNATGTIGNVIMLGTDRGWAPGTGHASILSGAAAGSTSIVVDSTANISVGTYLEITELNDYTYVDISGSGGTEGTSGAACSWCDGGFGWLGSRVRGQIVEVIGINGTTITISPGLYTSYSKPLPDWAANHYYPAMTAINPSTQPARYYEQMNYPSELSAYSSCTSGSTEPATWPTGGASVSDGTCTWTDKGLGTTTQPQAEILAPGYIKYAGVENLQIYANNTGYSDTFAIVACAYCWISGVESNYTDCAHVSVSFSYRGQIQNSYFSNAFVHSGGGCDSNIGLYNKSSGMLIQNNILERLHDSVILEWGPAGNVIAYNYTLGNFTTGGIDFATPSMNTHGAHPQFNLFEGNITTMFDMDSMWGSSSHNTLFRNWVKGAVKMCQPSVTGRSTVNCSGSNGMWGVQGTRAVNITFLGTSYNLAGNVVGSQDMAALTHYNDGVTPLPQVNQVVAVCGPSPCGPDTRPYDSAAFGYSIGYGETSDLGDYQTESLVPYATLFRHGDYSSVTNAVSWTNGVTHTLPASFYLSGKPAWFGSGPWPTIGPDVTGGLSDAYGHAYAIPAEVCYENVMGGTDGRGSPLTFNANRCYGQQTARPAPPSNLTTVVR